jgi:hypothetical protein
VHAPARCAPHAAGAVAVAAAVGVAPKLVAADRSQLRLRLLRRVRRQPEPPVLKIYEFSRT